MEDLGDVRLALLWEASLCMLSRLWLWCSEQEGPPAEAAVTSDWGSSFLRQASFTVFKFTQAVDHKTPCSLPDSFSLFSSPAGGVAPSSCHPIH